MWGLASARIGLSLLVYASQFGVILDELFNRAETAAHHRHQLRIKMHARLLKNIGLRPFRLQARL